MKKHIILSLITVMILVLACSKDYYDLNQSVFIEDVRFPGLPEYSNQGYNTFGAYINNQAFASSSYITPAEVLSYNDTLVIRMKGKTNYYPATLEFLFILPQSEITEHRDLVSLKNTEFNLAAQNCIITLSVNNEEEIVNVLSGKLTINETHTVYIDMDEQPSKTIIAGEFSLKKNDKKDMLTISNGRFDLSVGYDNFYYFEEDEE